MYINSHPGVIWNTSNAFPFVCSMTGQNRGSSKNLLQPPGKNGQIPAFFFMGLNNQESDSNKHLTHYMDVGQNGRPRGPQMLV